jgi:hypothetical protein
VPSEHAPLEHPVGQATHVPDESINPAAQVVQLEEEQDTQLEPQSEHDPEFK